MAKRKTGGRIVKGIFTFLLTIVLIVVFLYSACVYTLRETYTAENVYTKLENLDWSQVEVINGKGEEATMLAFLNKELGMLVGEITSENFNSFVEMFSFDTIAMSFAEDFRAWVFDDGKMPELDPNEFADIMISGFPTEYVQMMNLFGDFHGTLAEMAGRFTEHVDLKSSLEPIAPYRVLVSEDAMYISLAMSATLLLIILCINGLRVDKMGIVAGITALIDGGILAAVKPVGSIYIPPFLAANDIPKSTFNIIYSMLEIKCTLNGIQLALLGLLLLAVFVAINIIITSKRRRAHRAIDF